MPGSSSRGLGFDVLGLKRIPHDSFGQQAYIDGQQCAARGRGKGDIGQIVLAEQQTKLALILARQVFCGEVGKRVPESNLVALEINVFCYAFNNCESCPLELGLHTLEVGLNGHAFVDICLPHQIRFMLWLCQQIADKALL